MTDGLLESYMLGVLSDDDRKEAEHLLTTDPDLALQLEELEVGMEQYFLQNAVPPPPSIKTALQHRLVGAEIQKWEEQSMPEPPRPEPARSNEFVDVEVGDPSHIRVHKYWRAAFIAVFVLSKIFLAFGLYQYFKSNSLEQEIERLKATQQVTSPLPQGR
ncbi:hypothetical protein J2I46_27965 [Fibrella sp. HMF5405]|uniref:Anti-sigma factor n=1 Tax=Fibrella forsythiae TaxID=2817061 RepID=A0ABS3JR26_9BACT|nr:hypothetical protein [Fibrella forsythiae]